MLFEAKIIELLQAGANEFWISFFRIFTLFGSWLGFVLALIFIFFKNKKLSYAFCATYAVGVGLNTILKHIIMRPRPFVTWNTILNLGAETGFSMPSGHANSAALIAIFVSYYAIKYGKHKTTKICVPIIMSLYVAFICLSRLFLGVHYFTDVLAGVCEGVLVAVIGLVCLHFINKKLAEKKNGKTT